MIIINHFKEALFFDKALNIYIFACKKEVFETTFKNY